MKTTYRLAASLLALAALVPSAAQAIGVGVTNTYTNVVWSVSTTVPQLAGCNELKVDATGDLNNSKSMSIYGVQNCLALGGAYPVFGTAYFADNGTFTMNLFLGAGFVLQCFNWTGLNGRCQYLTAGTGASLGTAFLTLR